jgi:fructose-bisphosphate aldolase, class I
VVTLGGPKSDDVEGLIDATSAALGAGVRGVAYGRNVWLASDPFKVAARLRQVIHGS